MCKKISVIPVNSLVDKKRIIGGVAQWTSHLPQEQEDPGSNPARV
jgi:hypothetical protein